MNLLALAWLSELGIMQWRAYKQGRPAAAGGGKILWPSDLVASFVVFGALSVVAEVNDEAAKVAAAFGWALVLATVLDYVDPTLNGLQKQSQLSAQAGVAPTPLNTTVTQAHKAA